MRVLRCLVLMVMIGVSVALAGPTVNLKPGKYEIITEMSMATMKMAPVKTEVCLSEEDVKNMAERVKTDISKIGINCKASAMKMNGNTLTFNMTCDGSTFTTETVFAGDSFVQKANGRTTDGHEMNVKGTGKRVGACMK